MDHAKKALDSFRAGKNVFITGGAGTGKSHTLGILTDWASENGVKAGRTALTGMASLQLKSGQTIHSAVGIGIKNDKELAMDIYMSRKFQRDALKRIKSMDVLIVDEISMLRSDVLELIDAVLRLALDSSRPFGGMQVVFSGDFMQIPPVVKSDEQLEKFWAFQSKVWEELNLEVIYLTEIKRQDDPLFAKALNFVRAGMVSPDIERYFRASSRHRFKEGVEPVKLLSTNFHVDRWNNQRLDSLEGEEASFEADVWGRDEYMEKKIVKECVATRHLRLKPGCQVMLLKNDQDKRYVNGSMGEFVGVVKKGDSGEEEHLEIRLLKNGATVTVGPEEWKIEGGRGKKEDKEEKRKRDGELQAYFIQYPVKLAYAITIHKSQGMSIDFLEVDLKRCFAPGMAYVALSRARSYQGLRALNFSKKAVICDRDAFNYYMGLKNSGAI